MSIDADGRGLLVRFSSILAPARMLLRTRSSLRGIRGLRVEAPPIRVKLGPLPAIRMA